MKFFVRSKINLLLLGFVIGLVVVATLVRPAISVSSEEVRPIADAGSSRYAAQDPVVLDGTGSYDPDNSGPLSYQWSQATGPSVVITNANTAMPTVSGFTQTEAIQRCEFELVVSDGVLTSLPDTVEVIIVRAMIDYPDPWDRVTTIVLKTGVFDPEKPTVVFFGGGWGAYGYGGWSPLDEFSEWYENVNFINFPWYEADSQVQPFTYDGCANKLITYLSSVAPNYKQPIQALGHSTGTMPAITVANYLNTTYSDARYAINRVSLFDPVCRDLSSDVAAFCANPVSGEQCWVDNYYSHDARYADRWHWLPIEGALNVYFPQNHHRAPVFWHYWSLNEATWLGDIFNGGVTAGLYLSVKGPGKNLQLSTNPDSIEYYFEWQGDFYYADPPLLPTFSPGYMDFFDESSYPGRLPEPVTLIEPNYVNEAGGYILACEESQNAVGYELLSGSEPYRVMDYHVISDTPAPPNEVITTLPFEDSWWTVRVRDQYGSTIYADPEYINLDTVDFDRNGKVDFKDFSILAQYWHQNESSVDIAPTPSGDGVVDFKDLGILAGRWLTIANIALGQASNPHPHNRATDVDINTDLSWTPGDVAALHEVYFGSEPYTLPLVATQPVGQDYYDPGDPNIVASTTYYWRIDEVNDAGPPPGKWPGVLWSFTTISGKATVESPAHRALIPGSTIEYPKDSGIWYIYTVLDFWLGPTTNYIDPNYQTAYFSENEQDVINRVEDANLGPVPVILPGPPPLGRYVVGYPTFPPYTQSLERGKEYYWAVDGTDYKGNTFSGDVWNFRIQDVKAFEPSPPDEAILIPVDVACAPYLAPGFRSGYVKSSGPRYLHRH